GLPGGPEVGLRWASDGDKRSLGARVLDLPRRATIGGVENPPQVTHRPSFLLTQEAGGKETLAQVLGRNDRRRRAAGGRKSRGTNDEGDGRPDHNRVYALHGRLTSRIGAVSNPVEK